MKKSFISLLIIGLLALFSSLCNSQARIDYSYDQCVANYGPASSDFDSEGLLYRFKVGVVTIEVHLDEDYVYSITYKAEALSPEEAFGLMEKNRPAGSWIPVNRVDYSNFLAKQFNNGDLMAYYGPYVGGQYLCIQIERISDRKKAEQEALNKSKADRYHAERQNSLKKL